MKPVIFAFLIVVSACAEAKNAQDNSYDMTTPSCMTYPEWTGTNIDKIDLSILEDRPYRVIKPDSLVTSDYRPERLNINVDDKGVILMQECG